MSGGEGALSPERRARAEALLELYPHPRSALIPICHVAQEEEGWLTPEAIEEVAELVGLTPAEVLGTASFYDMLHTEPVGRFLVSVCTNIACMLRGAYELLEHAEKHLGVPVGGTTGDGAFTLEDAECLADCGRAPCLQVNHRFFGDVTPEGFEALVARLRAGELDDVVPPHGTLVRVPRDGGLRMSREDLATQRRAAAQAAQERAASQRTAQEAASGADAAVRAQPGQAPGTGKGNA